MANEIISSISKSLQTHFQFNFVHKIFFFITGLSIGIFIGLSFKTISFTILNSPSSSPPQIQTHRVLITHNMSDEVLFLKASSKIENNKKLSVPKVAFMFLTKGPIPLAPLWEKFFEGHEGFYSIYIHSSPDYIETLDSSSVFFGRRIPSKVCISVFT